MDTAWQNASFRGAAFFVEFFEQEGGRRGPNHEFPNKEKGFPEDTGGEMGKHSVAAYVATSISDPDYASRRDALIAALKQRGPGELVHPAFGMVQVQVRHWKEREGKGQLGLGVFDISFVDASDPTYPSASRSAAAGMPGLASRAHEFSRAAFLDDFQIAGKGDFLMNAARTALSIVADRYSLVGSLCGVPLNTRVFLADALDALDDAAGRSGGDDLPAAVAAFPKAITSYFEERHKSTRNADGTYRGTSKLRGNGPLEPESATALFRVFDLQSNVGKPIRDTATRQTEYANAVAIAALSRRSAIIEAARVSPWINWQTLQEAEDARDRIADAIAAETWTLFNDDLYASLTDMRSIVMQTIAPDNGRLPALQDFSPVLTMPSLALSHHLYGTADKADELVRINGLRHPGFFPGGEAIRIMSNA